MWNLIIRYLLLWINSNVDYEEWELLQRNNRYCLEVLMNEEKIKILAIVNSVNALIKDVEYLHNTLEALLKVKEIKLDEESEAMDDGLSYRISKTF